MFDMKLSPHMKIIRKRALNLGECPCVCGIEPYVIGEEVMESFLKSRTRMLLVGSVAVLGLGAAACTAPPATTPPTPWLDAGCIDSSVPGVPDFNFNGQANEADNATSHGVGGVTSEDGTCSGPVESSGSIVRAANSAAAVVVCDDIGVSVTNPARLTDFGYAAPGDAWTCVDVPAA